MTAADIADAHALTVSFGWVYRREDWAIMLALGEGIVAEYQGRLAGTALCFRYGSDWATMGLITVATSLQGQGTGRRMIRALLAGLEGRSIALHATAAGEKLYASLGFAQTGTIHQHQGIAGEPGPAALPAGMHLRPVSRTDLEAVAALDLAACGMNRRRVLAVLLEEPDGVVLESTDGPAGFALLRRFGLGEVIGPVVAPDMACARAMIARLLALRTGRFIRLDVPAVSGLGPWLATLGLAEVDRVGRMVRGTEPPVSPKFRTFGLASQSLG